VLLSAVIRVDVFVDTFTAALIQLEPLTSCGAGACPVFLCE
jgi:hypothetical protein